MFILLGLLDIWYMFDCKRTSKLANNLLARTMWSMYDTVESTVQFCLQKPNVLNSTLLKNTYEVSLIQGDWNK